MRLVAAILLPLCVAGFHARSSTKFLIASTARNGKVMYRAISRDGSNNEEAMKPLISTGLSHPQGLAVDQRRKKLYVAEPDARKIFAYSLIQEGDSLRVGQQEVAAENTESRWVSADSFGNIFFSDEPANQILKVSVDHLRKGEALPEVVYDASSAAEVSAPGGIVADNFHAYWVNKRQGTAVGSLIQASTSLRGESHKKTLMAMSRNADKSYGLCMSLKNVFYTQPQSSIYGVKKAGGTPQLITDKLSNPRGCAWDGDGSIYVADRGANAVYRFPGNMPVLGLTQLSVAARMEDAFGVAVFSFSTRARRLAGLCWIIVSAALTLAAL